MYSTPGQGTDQEASRRPIFLLRLLLPIPILKVSSTCGGRTSPDTKRGQTCACLRTNTQIHAEEAAGRRVLVAYVICARVAQPLHREG